MSLQEERVVFPLSTRSFAQYHRVVQSVHSMS